MNNTEHSRYYGDILSPEEIQIIGRVLGNFCDYAISFTEFQERLKAYGITVTANLIDKSRLKTQKQREEFNERVENNLILPTDTISFTLSSNKYNNVVLSYDRLMLETLAQIGDPVAKETLNRLIAWEDSHSKSAR